MNFSMDKIHVLYCQQTYFTSVIYMKNRPVEVIIAKQGL